MQCGSEEHESILWEVAPFVLLFPVGAPLWFGAVLLSARIPLKNRKPTPIVHATNFLHHSFRLEYFYWDVIDLTRCIFDRLHHGHP